MKNTIKLVSLLMAFALLLCACGEKGSGGGGKNNDTSKNKKPATVYTEPKDLISEKDYINRVEELCATKNFTEVDDAFLSKVDDLGNDLKDMIVYNKDEVKVSGTKYYVSNKGDDANDGLTPETAWATLAKVNGIVLKSGDAILFERGGLWRGTLNPQSGVTYSAYGKGYKPQISLSMDAIDIKWEKTDKENVWATASPITKVIGLILFNNGENYGEKKRESVDNLKENFDFLHAVPLTGVKGAAANGRIYLYYDGNPNEDFWSIEFSVQGSVVDLSGGKHDITLQNIEFRLGQDYFFASNIKNVTVKYCMFSWMGGHEDSSGTRYGGGGGSWHSCDTLIFEHCYFYQHFDAGVTLQYHGTSSNPCIYKDFKTTECLFEYCEYPFEYFLTQNNLTGEKYINTYFAYNFVRYTGYGFGIKATQSACVKSWSAKNPQENFVIEKNIFDRPYTRALDMSARDEEGKGDFTKFPEMNNNVYIANKNRSLIRLNDKRYRFNEEDYQKLNELEFETNAVYLFCEKY